MWVSQKTKKETDYSVHKRRRKVGPPGEDVSHVNIRIGAMRSLTLIEQRTRMRESLSTGERTSIRSGSVELRILKKPQRGGGMSRWLVFITNRQGLYRLPCSGPLDRKKRRLGLDSKKRGKKARKKEAKGLSGHGEQMATKRGKFGMSLGEFFHQRSLLARKVSETSARQGQQIRVENTITVTSPIHEYW